MSRRRVQSRISDETGANLASITAIALRPGANVKAGGATSIAPSVTSDVWVDHPGALKDGDLVLRVNASGGVSDTMTVNGDPVWDSGDSTFKVSLTNGTGGTIVIGTTGRIALVHTESAAYVDVYSKDVGGTPTSGLVVVSTTTGEFEFWVNESNVDLAILQSGALDRYVLDIPTEPRQWVRPEEFGAVADGLTDDSVAIQNAIDFAINYDLGEVRFEAKTYLINSTVTVTDTVTLKGVTSNKTGVNETKFTRTGTDEILSVAGTSGNNIFRARVEDIWFNGGDTDGVVVDLQYLSFFHFVRCKVNGTTNIGVNMLTCWEIYFDGVDFSFLGDAAGTYPALLMADTNNFRLQGCHFESNRGICIHNQTGAEIGGDDCNLIYFEHCKFENSDSVLPAIDLVSVVSVQIRGGVVSGARFNSTSTCPAYLRFTDCRWISIDIDCTWGSANPGVSTPDLTNYALFDSCEGVYGNIHISNGQQDIAGTELVQFVNHDSSEHHVNFNVTWLPSEPPSVPNTNLVGYGVCEPVIRLVNGTLLCSGNGTPVGSQSAPPGSIYMDYTNGDLYVKTSGTGSTNWKELATTVGFVAGGTIDMNGNDLEMGGGKLTDDTGHVIFEDHFGTINIDGAATYSAGVADPTPQVLTDDGAGSTGLKVLGFSSTTEQEIYFSFAMPPDWKEGGNITPVIHWCPVDASSGNVEWGLEYIWTEKDDIIGNSTIVSTIDSTDSTADKHHEAVFSGISGSGKEVGSIVTCRLFRDVTTASDYAQQALLLDIEIWYIKDSIGSDILGGKT